MQPRHLIARFAIGFALTLTSAESLAGDLTPPPGPIAETDRVILNAQTISLPYTINQPGSYVLTSDLINASGFGDGIEITASNVTLDLNGFSIIGSAGTGTGIFVNGTASNAVLKNGFATKWGNSGVAALALGGHTIDRITSTLNGGSGLWVARNSTISNCVASNNGTNGIASQGASTITNCVANGNVGSGISTSDSVIIDNCIASFNDSSGIDADNNCKIYNSLAEGNKTNGMNVLNDSLVQGCTSTGNTHGFFGRKNSRFESCVSTLNNQTGFELLDFGGAVVSSTSNNNATFGIRSNNHSLILNNNCSENGSSGISLSGIGSRIEANNCYANGFGIAAGAGGSAGNIIIKNTAGASTVGGNYVLINNTFGPIIPAAGVTDLTGAPGANGHPWANFEF